MDTTVVVIHYANLFKEFWAIWWFYYLFGYVGLLLHIFLKAPRDVSLWGWVKDHGRDLFVSFLCYQVVIVLWWDTGFEFLGFVKNTPNAMTFVVSYFSQSVITSVLNKYGKKMEPESQIQEPKQ